MNYIEERNKLQSRKAELIQDKRETEFSLAELKNKVRSGGRLPQHVYRSICDNQNTNLRRFMQIEVELTSISQKLRELENSRTERKREVQNAATAVCEHCKAPSNWSELLNLN